MGISIYYLVEFGLTENLANNLDKEEFSLSDILYKTPRMILAESSLINSLNKAESITKNSSFQIKRNTFNSIFLLLSFDISSRVLDLLINANIKSINELRKITEIELNISLKRKSNSIYKKLKKAIEQLDTYIICNSREVITLSILRILSNSTNGKSRLDIIEQVKEELNYQSHDINSTLNYLNESKAIQFDGNRVCKKKWSVLEFLEMPLEDHYLLEERLLYGSSLNKIGEVYGLSRQGIKNKQDKILDRFPNTTEENRLKDIFMKYDFTAENFCLLFSVNKVIWNFLDIKYNKGKRSEIESIKNEDIPHPNREEYLKSNNLYISFTGEYKYINKQNIFEEVLFLNRKKKITSDNFLGKYNSYIEMMNYEGLEVRHSKSIGGIATRSDYVIQSIHGTFRFFDNQIPNEFVQMLDELFVRLEGIYGVQKIYDENLELMFEIELESGDELANLVKRIGIDNFPNLYKIHRQSQLQIGPNSKADFLFKKLEEYSGFAVLNLVNHLYNDYGLKKESTMAVLSQDYKHFIVNDRVKTKINLPDQEEFYNEVNKVLREPIYLIDEFLKTIQHYWDEPLSVTQMLVQKFNYNLRSNYVVQNKFKSVNAAYRSLITNSDVFTVLDTKLYKTMDYSTVIYNLEKNFEILKISNYSYIKFYRLANEGISIEMLNDFSGAVFKFVNNRKYFTLTQIINEGFDHELLALGFEDIFYERLITLTESFSAVTRKSPILFAVSKKRIRLETFLSDELFEKESVNIDDFIDDINYNYCILFDRDNVKYQLINYGAFYSPEMDRVYIFKEKYYDEVYG